MQLIGDSKLVCKENSSHKRGSANFNERQSTLLIFQLFILPYHPLQRRHHLLLGLMSTRSSYPEAIA
jgi:hypothetical protein